MSDERSADEVFNLLSDEIRLDVLRTVALGQNEQPRTGVAELSFSDIYDRVDVDNTSKLSYHLGELTGTFLRKHEGGYAFTHAGERLVRFVLAENFREPGGFGPIELDGRCLFCGGTDLLASAEAQYFMVRCNDCERPTFAYRIRPAQVRHRSGDGLIDAVVREQAGDYVKVRRGVCPDCSGRLETTVLDAENQPVGDEVPVSFATDNECQQCLRRIGGPLTYAALYHPESIGFHWEHGLDVMEAGYWEHHDYLHSGRWHSDRVSTDPDEYRVEFQYDTDSLRVFLDESATVTRTERVRRTGV